jgi:hypothetical protein
VQVRLGERARGGGEGVLTTSCMVSPTA